MQLLIVNFHYYGNQQYKSGIYPVTPTFFENQLKDIAKEYQFISQTNLVNYFQKQEFPEGKYCLITFDDGLKQQMSAFNWLIENNIPAIFYVPTMPIKEGKVLDVHKLHFIRANIEDNDLIKLLQKEPSYEYTQIDKEIAINQYKYDNALAKEIKYQLNFKWTSEAKDSFINNTFNKLFPNESLFSEELYMSESDIQLLANANMLGSHGHAHIPLAQSNHAKNDILTSINFLEQLTQKPVLSFSYPYGSKAAVNVSTTEHFIDTNVVFALTMWRGINESLDLSQQPYLLKRIDTNDAPAGKNNSLTYSLS
jgi:peptidoglycan/xylan/chitin deacetylase (PgdA/CDA1 family)